MLLSDRYSEGLHFIWFQSYDIADKKTCKDNKKGSMILAKQNEEDADQVEYRVYFQGYVIIPYDRVMVDTWHYALSKPTERCSTKDEPNVGKLIKLI